MLFLLPRWHIRHHPAGQKMLQLSMDQRKSHAITGRSETHLMNEVAKDFHDGTYKKLGFAAQRLYPNEELLRFFGSYYFSMPLEERKGLRVLEVGCGSGANLWMIAREGFEAHGIDLSAEGLQLCQKVLSRWQVSAALRLGDMTSTGYPEGHFDAVVDVFSAYCFDESNFSRFLDEVTRILKPGGRFFSYTPSKNSDSFRDPGPSQWIDPSTLDGIHRTTSPFFGQLYPFRFTEPEEYQSLLQARGFSILRNERIGRTYRSQQEYFEFTSIHAQKDCR
jgi:ubiquinone/menaquinone biosynthesis C-methylase UbiE